MVAGNRVLVCHSLYALGHVLEHLGATHGVRAQRAAAVRRRIALRLVRAAQRHYADTSQIRSAEMCERVGVLMRLFVPRERIRQRGITR